jgi:hypothetical protein
MTRRDIERAITHAQLRLMSSDDESLDDATKYLTRALMGCFELKSKSRPSDVGELALRAAGGEG